MATEIRTCTQPNLRTKFLLFTVRVSVSEASGFRKPGQNTEGTSNYHLCVLQIDRQKCSDIDRFPQLRCRFCANLARKNNEAHRVVVCADRAVTELPPQSARAAGRARRGHRMAEPGTPRRRATLGMRGGLSIDGGSVPPRANVGGSAATGRRVRWVIVGISLSRVGRGLRASCHDGGGHDYQCQLSRKSVIQ
jgi:hypothetical protein